ncbi:MAG: GNAT family N-acetyltransferase [Parasphingorhabdus sp.]
MSNDVPITMDVPQGHIADVITHLEMHIRPEITIPESSLSIVEWQNPEPEEYLKLFRAVGERWLWLSRLLMNVEELTTILHHDQNHVFQICSEGNPVGLLELDFGETSQCEIGFFGLIPSFNGKGHGSWLMAETLNRAWRPNVNRVWLHTCTLDSPFALGFYHKSGFKAFKREVSMGRDPRLLGLLPKTAGPHIPIIS